MSTVTVSMAACDRSVHLEACGWTPAGIRRRRGIRPEGPKLPARNAAGQGIITAMRARGEGVIWDENGRKVRGQVWCDAPYTGQVWLKVWEGEARFAGEMRLAQVSPDGAVTSVSGESYDAGGERSTARQVA